MGHYRIYCQHILTDGVWWVSRCSHVGGPSTFSRVACGQTACCLLREGIKGKEFDWGWGNFIWSCQAWHLLTGVQKLVGLHIRCSELRMISYIFLEICQWEKMSLIPWIDSLWNVKRRALRVEIFGKTNIDRVIREVGHQLLTLHLAYNILVIW